MIVKAEDLKWLTFNLDTIICAGWFDMFHVGHLRFLKEAKKYGKNLIVVVMNDQDGKYLKGDNRPIISQDDRAEIINSLKFVDFVTICENNKNLKRPNNESKLDRKSLLLWDRYISIIEELKPKKVFSLEETLKFNELGEYIESLGVEVIYTEPTEGISTTEIVRRLEI